MEIAAQDPDLIPADAVEEDVDECASNLEAVYSIARKYYDGGLEDDHLNLLINSTTDTLNILRIIKNKYREKRVMNADERKTVFIEQIKQVSSDKEIEVLCDRFTRDLLEA